MEKPDWTYEAIHKDVYPELIRNTIAKMEEKLNTIEREELEIITNGVYLEGVLDGIRVMDYIWNNYF